MEADVRRSKRESLGRRVKEEHRLKVVIVEPHHHALEHIHDTLRRQRRLGEPWSLCHIDAHPDLACPSNGIPAAASFRPRDEWTIVASSSEGSEERRTGCLYELLDMSTTGISEWILPMVLAAGLTFVEWVKPPTGQSTSQIPLGRHKFHVGAHEEKEEDQATSETDDSTPSIQILSFLDLTPKASVKVDWDCMYYRDDDCTDFFSPRHLLFLPQQVELSVVEWSPATIPTHHSNCETGEYPNSQPWILDICLDYFYCINPFLADIESIDKEMAKLTHKIVSLWTSYDGSTVSTHFNRQELLEFRLVLRQSLQQLARSDNTDSELLIQKLIQEAFQPFIGNKQKEAQETLRKWYTRLEAHGKRERSMLFDLIVESIPHVMLPHFQLNDIIAIEEYTSTALENFEHGLRQRLKNATQPPFLITIARSMNDGFTPETHADYLQNQVKRILHKCFCDNDCKCSGSNESCRLRFLHDYDSVVQATSDSH